MNLAKIDPNVDPKVDPKPGINRFPGFLADRIDFLGEGTAGSVGTCSRWTSSGKPPDSNGENLREFSAEIGGNNGRKCACFALVFSGKLRGIDGLPSAGGFGPRSAGRNRLEELVTLTATHKQSSSNHQAVIKQSAQ